MDKKCEHDTDTIALSSRNNGHKCKLEVHSRGLNNFSDEVFMPNSRTDGTNKILTSLYRSILISQRASQHHKTGAIRHKQQGVKLAYCHYSQHYS